MQLIIDKYLLVANLYKFAISVRFQRSQSKIDSLSLSSLDMSGFITTGGEILLLLDRIALASRALRNLTRIGLGRSCFYYIDLDDGNLCCYC